MVMQWARSLVRRMGYEVVKAGSLYPDFEPEFLTIYERCRPATMTSPERMYALYSAVNYLVSAGIPGDMVECGVWKGGSSMVTALTLMTRGDTGRRLYLYDTYTGMSEPTEKDKKWSGQEADEVWRQSQKGDHNEWCYAPEEEVRLNMVSTGYPKEQLFFVKGKVEETIPATIPGQIALLRLDTDWYESTLHELEYLYPLLSPGGVLLLDDYGSWQGARDATDEYFRTQKINVLLQRIDNTGRLVIKP